MTTYLRIPEGEGRHAALLAVGPEAGIVHDTDHNVIWLTPDIGDGRERALRHIILEDEPEELTADVYDYVTRGICARVGGLDIAEVVEARRAELTKRAATALEGGSAHLAALLDELDPTDPRARIARGLDRLGADVMAHAALGLYRKANPGQDLELGDLADDLRMVANAGVPTVAARLDRLRSLLDDTITRQRAAGGS